MPANCLVLYSGGLDSILACRVLEEQGLNVLAVRFITPFFGWSLKGGEEAEAQRTRRKYGIQLMVRDISGDFLRLVRNPPHGYGRYLNPCIDCKILMVRKALSIMRDTGATFVATGEVLGQRPMSQRRDTLRIIERDSGAEGLLLRPLSARFLPETRAEKQGMIKRRLFPAISGRGRKVQLALAERYGITDFPAPAGGCVLTDPILSGRFKMLFETFPEITANDCVTARTGRHFLIEDKGWVIIGRNERENLRLEGLALPLDVLLRPMDVPGPFCILRYQASKDAVETAARIVARYSRAGGRGGFRVTVKRREDGLSRTLEIDRRATDRELDSWRF